MERDGYKDIEYLAGFLKLEWAFDKTFKILYQNKY